MQLPGDELEYRVDELYRDSTQTDLNQFYAWLGVKNSGGVRPAVRKDGGLAFLVLVSAHVRVATYNPWEDVYDPAQGRLWYWGDAKAHAKKVRDDWVGNRYLQRISWMVTEGRWSEVPPILHFRKPSKGLVQFTGLCVLKELRNSWMEDAGRRVQNYRASLEVLPVERVSVAWLRSLVEGQERYRPREWARYVESGQNERLLVYARSIRSSKEQLPSPGTNEAAILKCLRELPPAKFERLVVRAFQQLEVSHDITQTRQTRDGGFDFFGSFRLPPPLSYTIPLKGEVKRYKASSGVGPADVARLVARLQRGEHGVFATTSYFTQQAQDEIQADRYPIELVPGGKLVGLLTEIGAASKGEIRRSWLEV